MNGRILTLALLCALQLPAAGLRAGTARTEAGRALAIAENKGGLALILVAGPAPLTRTIVDVVSARLIGQYGMDRSSLLFQSAAAGSPEREQAVDLTDALYRLAVAALADLAPADVSVDYGPELVVRVSGEHPAFQFVLPAITSSPAGVEQRLTGPIRSSYKDIDLVSGLKHRDDPAAYLYPVQAIRFGRGFTIVATGGQAGVAWLPRDVVTVQHANGWNQGSEPAAGLLTDAVRDVLAHVGIRGR